MPTWGTSATVDASGVDPLAACQLTSTLAIVVYKDGTDINARTITIGDPPTVNSETTVGGFFSAYMQLVRVTDTSAMIFYNDSVDGPGFKMLTVSGTTITANSILAFSDPRDERFDLSLIDSTHVLCAYSDGTNSINAVVLSISGTTITENTIVEISTDQGVGVTCVAYSTTKGLVTWQCIDCVPSEHKGMIIDISGTTITGNTAKQISTDGGPASGLSDINQYFQVKLSSTLSVYMFNDSSSPSAYIAYTLTLNGTTFDLGTKKTLTAGGPNGSGRISAAMLTSTTLIVVSQTDGTTYTAEALTASGGVLTSDGTDTETVTTSDWVWCAEVDSSTILVHYETTSTSVATITQSGDEGSYVIGTAIDNETDGGTAFITLWRDNNLYLQRWDLPTLTKEIEITLGGASLTQVQNRTKVAYPYAGSATRLWVFGNMDDPAYVTGTVHLIQSTNGGASGSWTIEPDLSSWSTSDILDSLFVTPDLDGIGTRQFSAIRRQTGAVPELWQGLNALSLVSGLPFPTGSSVEYRGMHMGQNQEISVGIATLLGTGTNRIVSAISPYTSWTDITNNYPSGTVEVLRYL